MLQASRRQQFKHTASFVALLAVSMSVFACNGGSDGSTTEETELERLAAAYVEGIDGKFVYDYTTTNFGTHPIGIRTFYRLADKIRDDWNIELQKVSTIVVIAPPEIFVCTETEFLKDCNRATEEQALNIYPWFTPIEEIPRAIATGIQGAAITKLPDETIAGVSGRCFDLDVPGRLGVGPTGTEEVKVCFSERGVLLSINRVIRFTDPTKPIATLDLTALEVSEATPADFEPISPIRG